MSSIAYITDPNMIDFHRLRGNRTMVFWRFSLKGFARFSEGDLFFFIDHRMRHPKTKEKGLVGYGRCSEIKNQSLSQAWKEYENKIGYNSYDEFKEAIRHYRKNDHRLPNQIQTIKLENVIFFQQPVFLSEIGVPLSDRLESFTYIEDEGKDLSYQLFPIIKKIGVDSWMQSQNLNIDERDLERDYIHQKVRYNLSYIEPKYNDRQIRILKNHTNGVAINNIYYEYHGNSLKVFLPMTSRSQIYYLLGIKTAIESIVQEINCDFSLLTNIEVDRLIIDLLTHLNVKLVNI